MTLIKDGTSVYVPIGNTEEEGPLYAIRGPAELSFPNAVVVSYQILRTTNVQTVVVRPGSPGVFTVNAGSKVKLFRPFERWIYDIAVARNGFSPRPIKVSGGEEFDGELRFTIPATNYVRVVSYLHTEDAVSLPEFRTIQAPGGNHTVSIEKTFDLTNWFPVLLKPSPGTGEAKAFYRLSIGP